MNDILIICMSIDSGAANVYTIDTNYNSHSPGGMDMTFAERLRRLREQRGYTQAELAEAAGVTPRTVQYYESPGLAATLEIRSSVSRFSMQWHFRRARFSITSGLRRVLKACAFFISKIPNIREMNTL